MIRLNGVDRPTTINEPTTQPMGSYHLADNPNLYEIQRANNFEFVVTDLDGLVMPGTDGRTFPNAQEVLRMSVVSCPIPHFTQESIKIRRGNSELKFAGVPSFSSGTIVLNDYIGAAAKEIIQSWQHKSYNVYTEKIGLLGDYKKDAYLIEYTPDLQKVRQWVLHGCWVSGISESDYSFESSDKHQISVTIEYDRAEIDTSEM